MGRLRFVEPTAVRLTLADGDYIDIKKSLTHGEREDMFAAMSPTITVGERRQLDTRQVRTAKVLTYLLGWSLTGTDGQPVHYAIELPEQARVDILRGLETWAFDEIHQAIERHEIAQDDERLGKKKSSEPSASRAISGSPSVAAGVTSGSVS